MSAQGPAIADLRPRPSGLEAVLAAVTSRLEALQAGESPAPFRPLQLPALVRLQRIFDLDAGELEILCLAAGQEIDAKLTAAIAALAGQEQATPGLAESLLGEPAWRALAAGAPLRRWRLIELIGSGPIRGRRLGIDERILGFLLGDGTPDSRLDGMIRALTPTPTASQTTTADASRLGEAWSSQAPVPVTLIGGRDRAAAHALVAAACAHLGCIGFRLSGDDIPGDWTQRHALAVLLDRELALSGATLLIECHDEAEATAAARLADSLMGPVAISAPEPVQPEREPKLRIELPTTDRRQRRALWQAALGARADDLGPDLDRLAEQFSIEGTEIRAVAADALQGLGSAPGIAPELGRSLWHSARQRARARLDGLAQRVESGACWNDLVLPGEQLATLKDLASHVHLAWTVNQDWGWAARGGRGLGAAALFAGASGTGKTLAAEVIANALSVDLYRIDLSQVVSKYIGETEKNLSRIFSAAEDGGAILLFDEADALFGKRSEVKDSHDRYANVEVSYLLQQMESYRGLAILTTNQRSAVDRAFLRRLRYVVAFPFPDAVARAEIWAGIFPPETPTEGLDPRALARLGIAGGGIRSIALNAAFLAAAAGEPVRPGHILRAARREYAKQEKPFTASDLGAFR